ncbi:TonB-dependent receptor, partial [bacterium]|nr:TonB-dependent receptor [bacterium]
MIQLFRICGGAMLCLSRKVCFVVAGLAIALTSQPVLGDSQESDNVLATDTTEATYRLEEIIVVGNRTRFLQPAIAVLDAEKIAEKKAASAADVLRLDPALSVTSGAKSETETRLRGFAAEQLLVLVDGRPINPGNYGKVDLAMIPVENIAKVKIIKGPASVVYGPNSMGGVLNIITKNGREKPQTVFAVEFGDREFRQLSLNHSRSLGKWNYWLSLHENHSRGFELSEDFAATSFEKGGVRDNSGYHKIGFDSKLGYARSDNELYAVSVGYHWAEKSVPPTIYSWDSPSYRKFPSYERLNSSLSGTRQFSSAIEMKSLLFIDGYHDRLVDYLDAEMSEDRINWDSKIENWTVGGSLDGTIKAAAAQTLRCGLMLKRDLMNKQPDLDEPWETDYQFVGNVYVEDRIQAAANTEAAVGLGYAVLGTESESFSTGEITPSISVFQKLPLALQLSGGYSHAIHFATIHQLYGTTSGNPDLQPEKADKWEASMARKFFN